MIVFKTGTEFPETSLYNALEIRHGALREFMNPRVQKRIDSKVPLDGMVKLGDYNGQEDHKTVMVKFKNVSWTDKSDSEVELAACQPDFGTKDKPRTPTVAERTSKARQEIEAYKKFLKVALVSISGLTNPDGSEIKVDIDDDGLNLLADAGLIAHLYNAGISANSLSSVKKKLLG